MDSHDQYGKPLIGDAELRSCLEEMETIFSARLRKRLTPEEMGALDGDNIRETLRTVKEIDAINPDTGLDAIDEMLLSQRIDPDGMASVCGTLANECAMTAEEIGMKRAIMTGLLAAFQIGWIAHEKRDEMEREEQFDAARS